ncbi:MAG: sulfur carrier protein ThiS [Paludibacteraceae bacterium]|jgi:sulfur carrier protein|nr:sulfur carrier protein ThiS [Paludibacteraceae bacterium]
MEILFNQQPLRVSAANLLALSLELELPTSGIAMAVNNRLVPRTQWQDFLLQDGMSILVIKAVCGG